MELVARRRSLRLVSLSLSWCSGQAKGRNLCLLPCLARMSQQHFFANKPTICIQCRSVQLSKSGHHRSCHFRWQLWYIGRAEELPTEIGRGAGVFHLWQVTSSGSMLVGKCSQQRLFLPQLR